MQFRVRIAQRDVALEVKPGPGASYSVEMEDRTFAADLRRVGSDPIYSLLLDGKSYQIYAYEEDGQLVLILDGQVYPARVLKGNAAAAASAAGPAAAATEQRIVAPMPGVIVNVLVAVGDQVERNAPVVVIESMKMNNQLRAPAAGTIKAVNVQQGQRVERGQVLVVLE